MSEQTTTIGFGRETALGFAREAALWFGAVYLASALAGLLIGARGGQLPFGLPLDGARAIAVASIGVTVVLAARGRRSLKYDLPLALLGALAALALIGLVRGA